MIRSCSLSFLTYIIPQIFTIDKFSQLTISAKTATPLPVFCDFLLRLRQNQRIINPHSFTNIGVYCMVSYKPLFRYCLEHDITRADCRRICGISPNTWTKINRNEEVSMGILTKSTSVWAVPTGILSNIFRNSKQNWHPKIAT